MVMIHRQGLIEAWNGTKTGYYLKKFMDPETNGQYNNNTNTWVEFRYAEILLNYAEACIELAVLGQAADLQNGIEALNQVRNRAGLPDRVTTDPLVARDYIRHERAIEFFGEGHRWFDTRRWMIRDQVTTNVYGMKIKQYDNGNMEWKLDMNDLEDTRTWAGDYIYWLPIDRMSSLKLLSCAESRILTRSLFNMIKKKGVSSRRLFLSVKSPVPESISELLFQSRFRSLGIISILLENSKELSPSLLC